MPVFTAAFLFANVIFAGFYAVSAAVAGDESFKLLEFFGSTGNRPLYAALSLVAALWAWWAVVFYRMTRADGPETLMLDNFGELDRYFS